jgi:hypothetical protein
VQTLTISVMTTIATVVLLPLLIDWVKRRWDYSTTLTKVKFDVLFELNTLIWNYYNTASSLWRITKPRFHDIITEDDIKDALKVFLKCSDELYTGLFSYQAKISQYYDDHINIRCIIHNFMELNFHEHKDVSFDGKIVLLTQTKYYSDDQFRSEIIDGLEAFRAVAESMLNALATELKNSRSLWYPLKKRFAKRSK